MLKEYVRDSNGQPIGVIISDKLDDDKIHFGWSLCHENDPYDKKKGLTIAIGRMYHNNGEDDLIVPSLIVDQFEDFMLRSMKYFKTRYPGVVKDGYIVSCGRANPNVILMFEEENNA